MIKRRMLSIALATLLAASMLQPAFAAYVAEVDRGDDDVTQYELFKDAVDGTSAYDTLRLLDDVTVDLTNEDWKYGVQLPEGATFDLNTKELEIIANNVTASDTVVGVDVLGFGESGSPTTIKNGTISMNVNGSGDADVTAVQIDSMGEVNIEDMTVGSKGNVDIDTAIQSKDTLGYGDTNANINIDNCVVKTESGTAVNVEDDNSKVTISSGVYDNLETSDKVVVDTENGSKEYTALDTPSEDDPSGQPVEPAKKPTVIYSDKTAAIVKDEDGEYHLYDDLSKAVGSSNGKPVVVLNQEAIKDLKLDEGETLILVDEKGIAITDVSGITPPEGFEVKVENGVISVVKKDDGNQGGNQGGTNPPVIDPGIEGPGEMDGPGEVEIDDPDTPLASLPITLAPTDKLTRGMLMSILYQMDNAPAAKLAAFIDVAADSDYAEAIGWASANGIAKGVSADKFAPEDFVTRGQLVTFLNRYAAYVGSDVTVELNGNANEVITWAVAEEIINDFFARLNA